MTEDFFPEHDFPDDAPYPSERQHTPDAEEIIESVLSGRTAPDEQRFAVPQPYDSEEPAAEPEPFANPEEYDEPEPPKGTPWTVKLPVTLLILAVCGFAVFCIVRDIQKGTAGGGFYRAGDIVQVNLVQGSQPC